MSWKLAPALTNLRNEVNAKWPNRDKKSDGTIGDAAHSARDSQHNPNNDPTDDVPDGYVTAMDIDKDGINVQELLRELIGDPRVWYVIYNQKIYSLTHDWEENPYNGTNPHTTHVHVSLRQTKKACNDPGKWFAAKETELQRVTRIAHQRLTRIKNLQKRIAQLKRR